MALWLNDTFTGAPGTNIIGGHAGEMGASAWTAKSGFQVLIDDTGGRVYSVTTAGVKIYPTGTAAADGDYAEIVFDMLTAQRLLLFHRYNIASNTGYAAQISMSNTVLSLHRSNGAWEAVGGNKTITILPTGNVLRLKTTGTGESITLEVTLNGTTWTETDTATNRIVTPGSLALEFAYVDFTVGSTASNTTGAHITQVTAGDSAAAESVKPQPVSAAVENAQPSVVKITMSEAMHSAFVPAASAFTVGGHTVSSVGIDGNLMILTCATPFVNGEALRPVAYTKPGTNNARDSGGNELENFSGLAITNNVATPADAIPPRFVSAQVANAQPAVILVTMDEALAASVPSNSAFTPSGGRTVTSVVVNGMVASVTVNTPYAFGDVITIAHAKPAANPRLQDAAGNAVESFVAQPVTNSISAPPAAAGSFTFDEMTNAGTIRASQACTWEWRSGGVVGGDAGIRVAGSGTTTAAGKYTASGLTAGPGYGLVRFSDGGICYQEGTVA